LIYQTMEGSVFDAYLHSDFNNAILAAVGYNFRRQTRWIRILLCLFLTAFFPQSKLVPA
jgi:transposase, IS5 family